VRKMSKTLGNSIGIQESPTKIFGKVMSIPDGLMYRYYELCTDLTSTEICKIKKDVQGGGLHPKDAKSKLAKMIVRDFHSVQAAKQAEEEFNRIFVQRLSPSSMPEKKLTTSQQKLRLSKLIVQWGLATSVGEAGRLITQEAVTINKQKVTDLKAEIDFSQPSVSVLRVGKHRFLKVIVEQSEE